MIRVKDLIEKLQKIENKEKYVYYIANPVGDADEIRFDEAYSTLEVFDDTNSSITLLLSNKNIQIK